MLLVSSARRKALNRVRGRLRVQRGPESDCRVLPTVNSSHLLRHVSVIQLCAVVFAFTSVSQNRGPGQYRDVVNAGNVPSPASEIRCGADSSIGASERSRNRTSPDCQATSRERARRLGSSERAGPAKTAARADRNDPPGHRPVADDEGQFRADSTAAGWQLDRRDCPPSPLSCVVQAIYKYDVLSKDKGVVGSRMFDAVQVGGCSIAAHVGDVHHKML